MTKLSHVSALLLGVLALPATARADDTDAPGLVWVEAVQRALPGCVRHDRWGPHETPPLRLQPFGLDLDFALDLCRVERAPATLLREDGVLVTSAELLAGAERVYVVLADGQRLLADRLGLEAPAGLAWLRIWPGLHGAFPVSPTAELAPGAPIAAAGDAPRGAITRAGEAVCALLAAEVRSGQPLTDARGRVVAVATRVARLPLPGVTLSVVQATPVAALQQRLGAFPLQPPVCVPQFFSWDSLLGGWHAADTAPHE